MHFAMVESGLKGLLVGVLISLPTGPVGFLCIRRTLAEGYLAGLFSALGALTADMLYSSVVIFGLHRIAQLLHHEEILIRFLGGLFLIYLGGKTFTSKRVAPSKGKEEESLLGNYLSTFLITITNPIQLITFSLVFTAFGALDSHLTSSQIIFISSLLVGALIWWVSLVGIASHYRKKFTDRHILLVNKIAGIVVLATGCVAYLLALLALLGVDID